MQTETEPTHVQLSEPVCWFSCTARAFSTGECQRDRKVLDKQKRERTFLLLLPPPSQRAFLEASSSSGTWAAALCIQVCQPLSCHSAPKIAVAGGGTGGCLPWVEGTIAAPREGDLLGVPVPSGFFSHSSQSECLSPRTAPEQGAGVEVSHPLHVVPAVQSEEGEGPEYQ